MVKIKSTNDSKLINKLIANKLIWNLVSYLSYLYLIFWLCQPFYLGCISMIASLAIAFCYSLATILYSLLVLIFLLVIIFNSLSTIAFCYLLVSTALSAIAFCFLLAIAFSIMLFYLYLIILQDLSVTPKSF